MAHFAKLNEGNIVETIEVVSNDVAQTSYNPHGGVHLLGGTPFRKNFAGIGYTYDEAKDAFIAPQNYSSWTLNETTCQWEAPVAEPELTQEQFDNDLRYHWNDENQTWDLVDISELR